MPQPRNVLIFHQAALGDFIVTWPLAVALGRTFPQSRVRYITSGQKGKLAEEVLRLESADIEHGWHSMFAPSGRPSLPVAKLLLATHTIISFVSSGRDDWADNARRLAPQAQLIFLQTRPAGAAEHVTADLLKQLEPWPIFSTAMSQMLSSVNERGIGFRRAPDRAIVIHPGGGKAEKCWPIENFIELIENLKRLHPATPARLLLGEVELDRWPASQIEQLEKVAEVRPLTSLLDLLHEVSAARLFIGNDSGPGHLAAIIGVPTISLFGSDSRRWRPLGPSVRVIEAPSMNELKVQSVADAADQSLHQ